MTSSLKRSEESLDSSSLESGNLHESLSSLTLDRASSVVSRPRRRASVSNFNRNLQWQQSEAARSDPPRGYPMSYRRRAAGSISSPSLFGMGGQVSANPNDPQPPLPSLGVIASELFIICSLYCKYAMHSLRKPCGRFKRVLCYILFSLAAVLLLLSAWILTDFYADASSLCSPPPGYEYPERPLVEYYVHGRGIGHYARSVAIVQQLNKAGVDVRMYLPRAAMWRALHEDAKTIDNSEAGNHVGTTTAISVVPLTPRHNVFETLSHTMERIVGDCEVAAQSNRYPNLIISDGDFPGMLRAWSGGIPSVGIAHGQLFSIAQKPDWIKKTPQLDRAWNSQGRLNAVSSFFSEWQIATHFCFLESKVKTGVVARAPLRPEVLRMAQSRKLAREGQSFPELPHFDRVRTLLFGDEKSNRLQGILSKPNSTITIFNGTSQDTAPVPRLRKVVICYFRDHNGEMVVRALLNAGFDVLLFDNGYFKDMLNDPTRYGVKWIVHNSEAGADTNNEIDRRVLRIRASTGIPQDNVEQPEEENAAEPRRRLGETLHAVDDAPRLIRVMDRSLFVPLMHIADGVASSAGSQLMSECVYSHMPLLALYLEQDDEQKLNVELSRHPGMCHKREVFGTSFERLSAGLRNTNSSSLNSPKVEELKRFVDEVRSSRVSETFYRNIDSIGENPSHVPAIAKETTESEDPFQGLPDAAAIILEIIKQVIDN